MALSGFLLCLVAMQVVDMRDADLRGIAGIDRAPARAGAVKLRRGVVGVDDIFRLESEAGEVGVEQRRVGVGIEKARNADAISPGASALRAARSFTDFEMKSPLVLGTASATTSTWR